jgi:hypothetical protein
MTQNNSNSNNNDNNDRLDRQANTTNPNTNTSINTSISNEIWEETRRWQQKALSYLKVLPEILSCLKAFECSKDNRNRTRA